MSQQQVKTLIRQLNADTGRTYGIASEVRGEWKGYTRYRHCLYEIVDGVMYKRTAWANTHAALLPLIETHAQKHARTQGAA